MINNVHFATYIDVKISGEIFLSEEVILSAHSGVEGRKDPWWDWQKDYSTPSGEEPNRNLPNPFYKVPGIFLIIIFYYFSIIRNTCL